jgi:formylglycine-generating enzyme required for sulfatase activity
MVAVFALALAGTALAGAPAPQGPLARQGYKLVLVEPGKKKLSATFSMGSPEAELGHRADERAHEVTLTRPYLVGATEVGQALWTEIMGTEPFCKAFDGVSLVGPRLPAQCVTWLEAVQFCNKLSAAEGLAPAYKIEGSSVAWDASASGFRLLTEAEWEYAARAGTSLPWAGAADEKTLCAFANAPDASAGGKWPDWQVLSCDDKNVGPAPLGSFKPNALGLLDMSGNVAEWVWDRVGPYSEQAVTDPQGPDASVIRAVRGGSWRYSPGSVRVAARSAGPAEGKGMDLGFRIARNGP